MERKTVSLQPRTHSRLTKLADGFGDSYDKIINRLIDEHFKKAKDD
jgi:hypothetical protein